MNARFSPCGRYRYSLTRQVNPMFGGKTLLVVMLNPSTADEYRNDPTVQRCVGFAQRWGYGTLAVANLSPLRATDPQVLKDSGPEPDEVAAENLKEIALGAEAADRVICAWGTQGVWEYRDRAALDAMSPWADKLFCLRKTKDGHPQHPLYVKGDIEPARFP